MTARTTRTAIWLRIFCAALLLSLGFAHKPLYATPSADPTSSYYLLPGGTFAGLCIGNVDQGKPGKSWIGCEACRLASNIVLPAPPCDHATVSRRLLDVEFPFRAGFPDRAVPRPGSPVRGPPAVFA